MPAKLPHWPRAALLTANVALPAVTIAAGFPWALMWACFIVHNLLAYALTAPHCDWLGPLVTRFDTAEKELWLTIDDGPDGPRSLQLAVALQSRGIPATFFVKGRTLLQDPEIGAAIVRAGHTLANHTFSHPMFLFWVLWPSRLRREVDATNAALARAGVSVTRWFRAPLGFKNLFLHPVLSRLGMRQIIWNARGRDGLRSAPERVMQRVSSRARPGAIVVLHELMPRSQETILRVVDELLAQGYRFVIPADEQLR